MEGPVHRSLWRRRMARSDGVVYIKKNYLTTSPALPVLLQRRRTVFIPRPRRGILSKVSVPATHSVTDAKGGRSGGAVIPNFVGPLSLRFAPSRTQTLFHNARVQTNTPHQNKKYAKRHIFYFGRSGGVRTRDLLPPRQTRYQAALHPENFLLHQILCRQKQIIW